MKAWQALLLAGGVAATVGLGAYVLRRKPAPTPTPIWALVVTGWRWLPEDPPFVGGSTHDIGVWMQNPTDRTLDYLIQLLAGGPTPAEDIVIFQRCFTLEPERSYGEGHYFQVPMQPGIYPVRMDVWYNGIEDLQAQIQVPPVLLRSPSDIDGYYGGGETVFEFEVI